MNPYVIDIQHVSKKYFIGNRQPYYSLRDSLTNGVTSFFKKNKRSGKTPFMALNNVSLKIRKGEIVAIIGRNGAGKSTLLKILSRITLPSAGKITITGQVGSLLEVGTGFHPELTGRENIYLNGVILGMSKKEVEEKIEEIINFSEIGKFIDTPVKRYSSGMYVRLAFSVAAHLQPEILIVDEVLAVGDHVFQQKCLGQIRKIANTGRTVLLVSHNLGLVKSLCQRVVLLEKGKIIGDGPTNKVISKYIKIVSKNTSSPKKIYPVSKNKDGIISKIRILNSKGKLTNQLELSEKAYAVIDYELKRDLVNCDVGVMISQAGQTLWIGLDNDANKDLLINRPKGVYSQIIELPTHVLMPGGYHLGPSMGYVGIGPIDNHFFDGIDFQISNIPEDDNHRVQSLFKGGFMAYIKPWKNYKNA